MKKILIPVLLFALLLCACGKTKAPDAAGETSPVETAAPETEAPQPTQLTDAFAEENFEYPGFFVATPFVDEQSGMYWAFFSPRACARCSGFFNGQLTDATLYNWGVKDDVMYLFPLEGEVETYPITYGEKYAVLGDMTLKEYYGSALEELYPIWYTVQQQVEATLRGE